MDFDSLTPNQKEAFKNAFRQIEEKDQTILNLYLWIALTASVSVIALWLFAGDKIIELWNQ